MAKKHLTPTVGQVIIKYPPPGKLMLMPNNELPILASAPNDVDEVWFVVVHEDDDEDSSLDDQTKRVTVNTNLVDFAVEIPYVGNATPPNNRYQLVALPRKSGTSGVKKTVLFTKAEFQVAATVTAKMSLWYAFVPANSMLEGPQPGWDNPVSQHKPAEVKIPWNANQATFSAAGMWRHDSPGHFYGPDGLAVSEGVEGTPAGTASVQDFGYQDVKYGSEKIAIPNETSVCTLFGLWKAPDHSGEIPDGFPFKMFTIGAAATKAIGAEPRVDERLFLGMHDGKRWHNNQGAVTVDITWQADTLNTVAETYKASIAPKNKKPSAGKKKSQRSNKKKKK